MEEKQLLKHESSSFSHTSRGEESLFLQGKGGGQALGGVLPKGLTSGNDL